MKATIFRKYDIRGIVERDFSISDAKKIGAAFGTILGKGKSIAVGMDVRLTSKNLKNELIKGLRSTGCSVTDIGVIPTPVLYFSICEYQKDAGVMVTASHNPPEYNGFKFRNKNGVPFDYQSILKIKEIIDSDNYREHKIGNLEKKNVIKEYLENIKQKIKLNKKIRVVVDAGNGTCGEISPKLLRDLGCEVKELYSNPDGTFPNHIPDPNMEETLTDLRKKVINSESDLGIAFDGDGDRVSFIDEKGNIIRSDISMILFTKDILKNHKNPKIVHEVKFSRTFIEYVKENGGTPVMTKVGYPNVVTKMMELKSPIGGEFSGHFYFRENNYYEDAIFAAVKFVEYLSKQNKPLSQIVRPFLKYVSSKELRIPCPDEKKEQIVNNIKETFSSQEYEITSIDGVRLEFENGWGLIRPSNTEPELSVRFEATTKQELEKIKTMILKELNKQI